MLYVREDIPSNLLDMETKLIEYFFYVEINLNNDNWLRNCSYSPYKNMMKYHLCTLSKKLDIYSSRCNSFIILGYLNIETEEQDIKDFCDNYGLNGLKRQPTCYQSPSNLTCIDLILTNA